MEQLIRQGIYVALLITSMGAVNVNAQEMKPEATEVWQPVPEKVTPGTSSTEAPSDAVVLFDGSDLSAWQTPQFKSEPTTVEGVEDLLSKRDSSFKHAKAAWHVKDGDLIVKPGAGAIETKRKFGDFQLHIEWMAPVDEGKSGQDYSNSGIFMMGLYEIQVLNSFENKTYSNGQAGSIYKQHIPLVNASRAPGEWQTYDIIFTAPKFNEEGSLESPASVTALHNGVLIQKSVELKGPTVYIGKTSYVPHPEKMPLRLQDHGNPIHYRNIWIRPLD